MNKVLLNHLMESDQPIIFRENYYDYEPATYQPPPPPTQQRPTRKPMNKWVKRGLVAGVLGAGAVGATAAGLMGAGANIAMRARKVGATNERLRKTYDAVKTMSDTAKVGNVTKQQALKNLSKLIKKNPGYPGAMIRGMYRGLRHPIGTARTTARNIYRATLGRWDD